MRMAYTVMQVPTRGMSAFCPTMVHGGLSVTGGLSHRYGAPGTVEVEVGPPGLPTMSFDPRTSPSANAPDGILPDIYFAPTTNMGPWADESALHTRQSDQELPVPALDYAHNAAPAIPASRRARIGGRRVWPNPRVVAHWPSARGAA